MDHSEARTLVTPFGNVSIYHLSGERGWKAVSGDIPPHGLRLTRTGIDGRSSYASDSFLAKFCDEAGLIQPPPDGDLQLIDADQIPSFDPECVGQLGIVWSERRIVSAVPDNTAPVVPAAHRSPQAFSPRMPDLHRNSSFDTDIGTGRQRVQYIYIRYGMYTVPTYGTVLVRVQLLPHRCQSVSLEF